jgi:hypothetical protein
MLVAFVVFGSSGFAGVAVLAIGSVAWIGVAAA